MVSELIIQLQNTDGSFNCEKFDNLPSHKSVFIAICFADNKPSEDLAIELKTKLINSIAILSDKFSSSSPPCKGNVQSFGSCHALGIIDNLKLLIVVSDNASSKFADNSVLKWADTILPVLKRTDDDVNLQMPFNAQQVAFWNDHIAEVIPCIYSLIGISDEDQRIFISYKRTDTSAFAEQLFDRLNHEGFEVFLDRFSIKPGINFQNRLYQELADKAMILFLESTNFFDSDWIKLEIAFAKKYRLGLYAVNTDTTQKIASIDDEYRKNVTLDSPNGKLEASAFDGLVAAIKLQHSVALYRMRNYLNNNIVAALQSKGMTGAFDSNGFINVTDRTGKLNYKIWATARPPKVNDYHYADISHLSGIKIIFGPEFIEQKREVINTWLSKKAVVDYYNEGQILSLINLIHP